jgi:hypothetical protein
VAAEAEHEITVLETAVLEVLVEVDLVEELINLRLLGQLILVVGVAV